jgi:hypothetical protein
MALVMRRRIKAVDGARKLDGLGMAFLARLAYRGAISNRPLKGCLNAHCHRL